MLAIALVLDGWSREAAAEACAMDRQTLRDWVHRYNAEGLDGLFNLPRRCRGYRRSSRRKWSNGLSKAQSWSGTAWCAGAVSICGGGSRRNLASTAALVLKQAGYGTTLGAADFALSAASGVVPLPSSSG